MTKTTQSWDPAAEVDRASAILIGLGQNLVSFAIVFAIVWLPILVGVGVFAVIGLADRPPPGLAPADRPATVRPAGGRTAGLTLVGEPAAPVAAHGRIWSMTEQAERYDRIAAGYATWWAPIIAPAAVGVLDEIADAIDSGAERILDIGTGTGTLPVALLRRWPQVRITAIDASAGMIEMAPGGNGTGSSGRSSASGSSSGSPSPTTFRSRTARSTSPSRRSCSSSSRTGPAPSARRTGRSSMAVGWRT